MKIAVIGGGSSYTPELVSGLLARTATLPLRDLWLMDSLPQRLDVVGNFARRMVAARGNPFRIHLTEDLYAAIDGAHYVITQLRVGWMQARRADEYLGRRHGLIGQETTGIGGMAKALRTIPVILNVARAMQQSAADGALLVNFTNPAGLVTQALADHAPGVAAVGICNSPYTMQMSLHSLLARDGLTVAADRLQLDTLGLNHLTWYRGLRVDGVDLWPRVLARYLVELRTAADPEWPPDLIATLGMIPNYYLHYFYATDRKLAEQAAWPPSRAEQVLALEEALLAQYAEPTRSVPPAGLMQRGGAYYSTVATQLLDAHHNDRAERHIVNLAQRGAVTGWPHDWVLEMPARVRRDGIHPLPAAPLPPVACGLLQQVKQYELLTVQAAVHGDRAAAWQALLAHPLGPPAARVTAALDDLLATHRDWLPQFFAE